MTGQFTIDLPSNALGTQPSENLDVQIGSQGGSPIFAATATSVVANSQPEPGNPAVPLLEDVTDPGALQQVGNAYTLDLGTLPVGDMPEINFAIANNTGAPADDLTGGFVVTTGSYVVFNGDTTFAALAPGQVYSAILASVDTGSLGSNSETLTFTPQELNASGYTAVLPAITLTINDTVELPAGATVNSPTVINFGTVRAGTTPSQAVSVTNSSITGAAALDASASVSGAATTTGAINQLAPGATDDTNLLVGLATSAGGAQSGLATVNFYADSGGDNTEFISSQPIEVLGSVYREAAASIPGLIAHVGNSGTQAIAITNSDPADGFSENLIATVVGTTGSVTTSGSATGDIAPQATSNALSVSYPTTATGTDGSVTLDLVTDGTGIDGFGTTDLGQVTLPVTIDNHAQAAFEEISGGGTFAQTGSDYTLNLGTIVQGMSVGELDLGVVNSASGPAGTAFRHLPLHIRP